MKNMKNFALSGFVWQIEEAMYTMSISEKSSAASEAVRPYSVVWCIVVLCNVLQCGVGKNGIDQIEGEILGYHRRDYGKFDCNLSWHKVT